MEQARQETQAAAPAAAGGTVRPSRDRAIKLVFVVATLAVMAMLFWSQRRSINVPGWGEDLSAALSQAAAEGRSVVVFFASVPPGETERWLDKSVLRKPENVTALDKGRFLKVVVDVGNLSKSKLANRYRIAKLPTMLLIGPDGTERNRREGNLGEVEFRTGFLDCSQVVGPAAASRPG
jgi:hypothetical protein